MDIKGFQNSRGLVADGIVGKRTIKELKEVYGWSNVQVAHFLGQTHIESAGFKQTQENLNYSAQALANTWPSRYAENPNSTKKTPNGLAKHLERKPKEIANNAYANRMGNGDEDSGDGWKHRGMGYIQLTGRDMQNSFAEYIGDKTIEEYPEKIATDYPLESAIFYFERNNLFKGLTKVDYATIKNLTKRINGGYTHLLERKKWTEHYYRQAVMS